MSSLKQKRGSGRLIELHEKIIDDSNKFDRKYYLKKYPEADSKNPIKFYLTKGAELGHNPSSWFDTTWYLENYTDVKVTQINPFVHYILFGKSEGRKPNKRQHDAWLKKRIRSIKTSVVENLWGGYSKPALKVLENCYSDSREATRLRFFTAWHAARWYYFSENYKKALELSHFIRSLGEEYLLDKTVVLMHSFCLMQLNLNQQAEEVLREYLNIMPDDADALLSMSNLYHERSEKLSWINKAFEKNGFRGIDLKGDGQSIDFRSLHGDATTISDPRRVSVIIPTFNAELRIKVAVESLLKQSWSNIEVIVVDDCSTDNTVKSVKQLMQLDSRVKLVEQKQNAGAYVARNAGLKVAKGDFITTHDSDDWSHPQKIASQVAYLDSMPKVKGVSTFWVRASSNLQFQHNWRLNERLIHWSHSSFLFRKEVLSDIGYWDNVIAGGDTEFIWRVQARYGKWAFKRIHSEVPMAIALDDEGSLTRNKATHIKTMHNGMRHIYREGCQWWHKKNKNSLNISNYVDRPFPAPQTMLKRGDNEVAADFLAVSDFSLGRFSQAQFDLLLEHSKNGMSIVLYHIPQFGKSVKPLSSKFYSLLMEKNISVCVFGMKVNSRNTLFLNEMLLKHVPDQLVEVLTQNVLISVKENSEIGSNDVRGFLPHNQDYNTSLVYFDELTSLSII
ncbi:glycosyltransferase [Alteromonas gracilis]|uniref:glycosyltransferase n=1 Tax=Alteromonas gracilis TaxID=1479524 RepID=UPI003735D114